MDRTEMRKNSRKHYILLLLFEDIGNDDLKDFYQLYETTDISNDELVARLETRRNIPVPFERMIYYDMLMVLIDRIMDDTSLESMFMGLYSKRYSRALKLYEKVSEFIEKTGTNDIPDKYIDEKKSLNNMEDYFFQYLLVRDDSKIVIELTESDYRAQMSHMDFVFYMSENEALDKVLERFHFKNTSEPIFPSRQFERMLKKRRLELAEYLKVSEEDIVKAIHSIMDIEYTGRGTKLRHGIGGLIEQAGKRIVTSHYGGIGWHDELIAERKNLRTSIEYKPDVDVIIENYYKSVLLAEVIPGNVEERKNKEDAFETNLTKIDIAHGDFCAPIHEDYQAILYLYEADRLYRMFMAMMEQYYRDFSWEKIANKSIEKRYHAIIDSYKEINADRERRINALMRQNEALSIQKVGKADDVAKIYEKEIGKLNATIESKDTEIQRLKDQITAQNEYIRILSEPEEAEIVYEPNMELLQTKKYLFVGATDESLPELKKAFSNSKYMTSETVNISDVDVDAVVFLIRWMSHSMYYKVKNNGRFSQIPWVYCNTKSFTRVCYDMEQELQL